MASAYRWLPFGALVLIALPLLLPAIPPLVDLPGHIGRYRLELDLDHSSILQRYYDYRWELIGNLGVDLLIKPIGTLFGLELGTKVIVILIVVLTAAGFLLLAREAHGHVPPTAAFALPLAYAYPLQYGFVNYCLSMALACLGFTLWLHLGRQGRIGWRAALFVFISLLIWVAHSIGWGLFCVMCAAAELTQDLQQGRSPLRSALACLPVGIPILLTLASNGDVHTAHGWLDFAATAKWAVALYRDRWVALDISSMVLALAVIGCGALRLYGLRISPVLGWPALGLLSVYLLAPQAIGQSYFVQARIAPYAAALALLAIDTSRMRPRSRRALAVFGIAFFVLRMGATSVSFALYDRAIQRDLTALDHMPVGSSVAVFSPQKCQGGGLGDWSNLRLQHLGGIALARRSVFVNDQWALNGLHLIRIRYHEAAPFEAEPSEVVTLTPCRRPGVTYLPDALARVPRNAFQFVWLLGVPPSFQPHESWLKPVWRTENGMLYRVRPTAAPSAPSAGRKPDRA